MGRKNRSQTPRSHNADTSRTKSTAVTDGTPRSNLTATDLEHPDALRTPLGDSPNYVPNYEKRSQAVPLVGEEEHKLAKPTQVDPVLEDEPRMEERTETVQVKKMVEELWDVDYTVVDEIVEIPVKKTIEQIVEVPEIETIEILVEDIQYVQVEKIVEVPKMVYVEKSVPVVKEEIVYKEVEVDEVQIVDVPVEKIIEVPEYQIEEIEQQVMVPQYQEVEVPKTTYQPQKTTVQRRMPVPVEAEVITEFTLPTIKPNYIKKKYPVYIPRFIEVPVPRQLARSQNDIEACNDYQLFMNDLKSGLSLKCIEGMAQKINTDGLSQVGSAMTPEDFKAVYAKEFGETLSM